MADATKDNIRAIKNMGKESIPGPMAKYTMVIGLMANSMEMENFSILRQVRQKEEPGRKANALEIGRLHELSLKIGY